MLNESYQTSHINLSITCHLSMTSQYLDKNNMSWPNMTSNTTSLNFTDYELPDEILFSDRNVITIFLYCLLFVVAASGNLTVFITLCRNKGTKIRVNLYILHLATADLIVTFVMMPMEIGWNVTVDWRGGDALCRILMFFRVFGLYLSSFVLVVISLDRYFAILHPLSLNDANRRGKMMLVVAWVFSVIASLPQVLCCLYYT